MDTPDWGLNNWNAGTSYAPQGAFFSRGTNGAINGLTNTGQGAFVGGAGAGLKAVGSAMGGVPGQASSIPNGNPLLAGAMGLNKGMEAKRQNDLVEKLSGGGDKSSGSNLPFGVFTGILPRMMGQGGGGDGKSGAFGDLGSFNLQRFLTLGI